MIVPGVLALVLTGAVAAQAHQPQPAAVGENQEASALLSDCNGGVQKQSLVRTQNVGQGLVENPTFAVVPGSIVPFTIAAGSFDQVVVTFSAEAALFGAPVASSDYLRLEIRLDGNLMQPADDLVFASDVGQASSIQVCQRVAPGPHHVWVNWRLIDQAANNTLTGRLDDWALNIQVSE
jgi:hypothetical protein